MEGEYDIKTGRLGTIKQKLRSEESKIRCVGDQNVETVSHQTRNDTLYNSVKQNSNSCPTGGQLPNLQGPDTDLLKCSGEETELEQNRPPTDLLQVSGSPSLRHEVEPVPFCLAQPLHWDGGDAC